MQGPSRTLHTWGMRCPENIFLSLAHSPSSAVCSSHPTIGPVPSLARLADGVLLEEARVPFRGSEKPARGYRAR